jgi:hypothetical protein
MVANTTSRRPTTIHLCGGPYVTVGSRRIEVPEGSKRVLAYAALRGCSIERRQIAGALWPYGDDNRAGGNLRSALWRLRGVGIDVIDADKWSISMQSDVHVDVTEICQWAGRLVSSRAIEADLTGWQDSVNALDLLPGWYDDWVIMERERVRQRLLHALEALCRLLAERGAYAQAVEAAMLAVDARERPARARRGPPRRGERRRGAPGLPRVPGPGDLRTEGRTVSRPHPLRRGCRRPSHRFSTSDSARAGSLIVAAGCTPLSHVVDQRASAHRERQG